MKLTVTNLVVLVLAAQVPATAGNVSATPGIFNGVVHFNAPFVPEAMEVDAQDVTHTYKATATASQNDPALCAPGSQDWCYSVTVESALASSYYLRAIATQSVSSPVFVSGRIPFPPTAAISITSGATVVQDIPLNPPAYQPGEISGNVQANDQSLHPLQLNNLYFSTNDLTNNQAIFQEGCGGSVEFCPFNSVFQSGAASPNPPGGPAYQLYLKPGEDYNYLTRALGFIEGAQAKSTFGWDPGFHFGAVTAGQNVQRNYTFNQAAQVSGTVQLAAPTYNLEVDINGATTAVDPSTNQPGSFTESFITTNGTNAPLTSPSYVSRIFDNADFSKGFSLRPQFTLSADGGTQLAYPPIPFTANAGDQLVVNFNDQPSSIAGRVTFDPPYPAGLIYPGIQAEAYGAAGGLGAAQTRLQTDSHGGSYLLPVFAGNWDYWRFGWNFDLGNPNFTSWYFVGQFLPIHIPVATGQALTGQDFNFGTAKIRVVFSAPPNATISAPQLDGVSGTFTGGNFTPDFADTAHSEGLNQTNVTSAEADMVVRVDTNLGFRITPSAVINSDPNSPGTSRTDFSPIVVKPNKGDVIIIGVPGTLSLTVNAPVQGQTFTSCVVPVSGTATGTTNITITVNGHAVAVTSAGNPNDPNQVKFSTTVGGSGANTVITVVASAPNNTSVTDVINVSATGGAVNTTAQVTTPSLWPPNHDLVNVGFSTSTASACDASPTLSVNVYSNESETADTGDGPFSPDAASIAPGTLRLRSERMGNGTGRIYLIIATGSDHSGDSGSACTSVVVPQDNSKASVAAVQAAAAAAVNSCKITGAAPAGFQKIGIGPVVGPKQ